MKRFLSNGIPPFLAVAIQLAGIFPAPGGEVIPLSKFSMDYQTLGHQPLTLDDRVWSMKFSADGKSLLAASDSICRIDWPLKQVRPI